MQLEHELSRRPLVPLDAHLIGIVDELAGQVREKLFHATGRETPAMRSSFCTVSVGWAPRAIHARARSVSISTSDGSICGL